jgi:hypothetical protein
VTARFCIFICYRGHHRKGVAIYNAAEVNLQQKPLVSLIKNVFFEDHREIKKIKIEFN